MKQTIYIPASRCAGLDDIATSQRMEIKDKLIQNRVQKYKKHPIVSFLLCLLIAYLSFFAYAELIETFCFHNTKWIDCSQYEHIESFNGFGLTAYIELIIGILTVIDVIAIVFIIKTSIKGFWMLVSSCACSVIIMSLYAEFYNAVYNNIGSIVLYRGLWLPLVVFGILQIKNHFDESLWYRLKSK